MRSKKLEIFNLLRTTNLDVVYNFGIKAKERELKAKILSDQAIFSYIRLVSISNRARVLSGQKHSKKQRYQISLFTNYAKDLDTDSVLLDIEQALESKGWPATTWTESNYALEKEDQYVWHYFLEVSV